MRLTLARIRPVQAAVEPFPPTARQIFPRQTARSAMLSAVVLGWATAAHAQEYYASLYSSANVSSQVVSQGENAIGPLITTQTVGPSSAWSYANYGLLGANDYGSSTPTGDTEPGGGSSVVNFSDIIPVSDGAYAENAIIPYTINVSLLGGYAVSASPLDSGSEGQAQISISVYTNNFNGSGTGVSGAYTFVDVDEGGTEYITQSGALSFSGSVENNTSLYFLGQMSVSAGGVYGGSGAAMYGDTGVFNMTSSVGGIQFIGTQGTNYGTLSDSGEATAPEPGPLGLIFPALVALGAGCLRRRRS